MSRKLLKWLKHTRKSKMLKQEIIQLENRFHELSDEIHSRYALGDKVLNTLYHYTDEKGLKGIINSGSLWLTNYKKLWTRLGGPNKSDPLELRIVRDYLNKAKENCLNTRTYKKYFENHMEKCECYTLSLCEENFNEELWKEYGKNEDTPYGGYAIGFNKNFFSVSDLEEEYKEIEKRGFGYVILKSEYVDGSNLNGIAKEYIDIFLRLLPNLSGIKRDDYSVKFLKNIYVEIPRYKQLKFQAEKEHRLYVMNAKFKPISNVFKTSNDQFIYRDEVKENLCEIVIGKNALMNEAEIRQLLLKSNNEARIQNLSSPQYNIDNIVVYRKF